MSLQEKLDKIRSPKLQNQHQVKENWFPSDLANITDRKQTAVVLSAVEGMWNTQYYLDWNWKTYIGS